MSDGLRALMQKGVVVSGDDRPVTEMGAAEGILAFAAWLDYAKADGSIPFSNLGRIYMDSQGWQTTLADFRNLLQPPPTIQARAENPAPAQAGNEQESPGVRVGPVSAVIIDPSQPEPVQHLGATPQPPVNAVQPEEGSPF